MKDSSKLLNFNQNRPLKFKTFRKLGFSSRRKLLFDIDRSLSFDHERNLPFGRKGVKFRHFICGGCGATVVGDAESCPKCKSTFKVEERRVISSSKVSLSERIKHSRMKTFFGEEYKMQKRKEPREAPVYRCGSCGSNLRYLRDRGKWYCDRCRIFIGTAPRGQPKKVRTYTPTGGYGGGGGGGTKFVAGSRTHRTYPSEVVIVEDMSKRRRGR